MKRVGLLLALALAACSKPSHVTLHYVLPDSLAPETVASMVTTITVTDGTQAFSSTRPRTVANGIVLSESTDASPAVLVTFNTAAGYTFKKSFDFTLLAPSGKAPQVSIVARAFDSSSTSAIGHSVAATATFSSKGSATVTFVDDRCGSEPCGDGTICCGGACIDPTKDSSNCGSCGTTCTGTTNGCTGSACTCDGASACDTGKTCANGCIDTNTDIKNCGAIGAPCIEGEVCSGGKCLCGTAPACVAGQICCGGTEGCTSNAGCECGGNTCPGTAPICCTTNSANTCTDIIGNDTKNCGACGKTCNTNEVCTNGDCMCGTSAACNAGDTCCTSGCKSLQADPLNCGGCGVACGAGETCSGGKCLCGTSPACTANALCCATGTASDAGGTPMGCVDPTQPDNCAACGNVCGANTVCKPTGCTCPMTSSICTNRQDCCPGSGCTDLMSDRNHCGSCTTVCTSAQNCTGSTCVASVDSCSPTCANNLSCIGGQCECGNGSGGYTSCSGAEPGCCGNACADLKTSASNCGACGTTCTGAANTCCNGSCVDVNTSAAACGTCGTTCPGNKPVCAAGACVQCAANSDCSTGQLCCGNQCITPSTKASCGGCNVACGGTCKLCSGTYTCTGTGICGL